MFQFIFYTWDLKTPFSQIFPSAFLSDSSILLLNAILAPSVIWPCQCQCFNPNSLSSTLCYSHAVLGGPAVQYDSISPGPWHMLFPLIKCSSSLPICPLTPPTPSGLGNLFLLYLLQHLAPSSYCLQKIKRVILTVPYVVEHTVMPYSIS